MPLGRNQPQADQRRGSQVSREAQGSFFYIIPVEEPNPYYWRGYGKDSEGKAVFSTKKQSFRGMAF
jgi:hypothetical protein